VGMSILGTQRGGPTANPAAIWHDLECGGYRADLPLWHELAQQADGPILDVGAGTGRVALSLAHDGYEVTALEREVALLDALRERAGGLPLQLVQADARSFALARTDYALCLVPMQTVQLLGGTEGRLSFLRHAREHLREGGLLACAILGELEPFDCSDGGIGPAPERTRREGRRYVSRALRVSETREHVTIERERIISSPAGEDSRERDVVVLDRIDAATLRHEGETAGFTPLRTREIAATDEHVSSSVVMLGA